jgi:hypothetical protein
VRADPDLAPLRADERFENVMSKFEPQQQAGIWGAISYQLNPKNSVIGRFMDERNKK